MLVRKRLVRPLSDLWKVDAKGLQEICEGLDLATVRLGRSVDVFGRRPFAGHIVIGALMDFLRRPEAEQVAILRHEFAEMERMCDRTEAGPQFPGPDQAARRPVFRGGEGTATRWTPSSGVGYRREPAANS
jgi:hypothetical protein